MQEFGATLFFRGLILDTFLRGLWWPNGLKSEVQFEVKWSKILLKIVFAIRFCFSIEFSLILVVPGPLKVRLSRERSLKNQEIDAFGKVTEKSMENDTGIESERR